MTTIRHHLLACLDLTQRALAAAYDVLGAPGPVSREEHDALVQRVSDLEALPVTSASEPAAAPPDHPVVVAVRRHDTAAVICDGPTVRDACERHVAASGSLSWAYLANADLAGAYLAYANIAGANLYAADLRGANLYAADLRGADLAGADLFAANIEDARRLATDPAIPGWAVVNGRLRRLL